MGETSRPAAACFVGIVLAVCVAASSALSLVALAREGDHDCTGDSCPICRLVPATARLACASATLGTAAGVAPSAARTALAPVLDDGRIALSASLFSLGVRLDL